MELRRRIQWHPLAQERNPLVPDGIFIAYREGHPRVIAVELELNAKNLARHRKLFMEYRSKTAMSLIWYIVATPAIGNTVLKQWSRTARFQSSPTLIVSNLGEVLRDPITACVFALDQPASRLGDWIDLKPPLTESAGDGHRVAQEVSSQKGSELSMAVASDSESTRGHASASEIQMQVPSAVDPSPATKASREGSTPTGTKDEEGAEVRKSRSESEAAA